MRSSQSDERGFVMVVLIIVMGIGAMWMTAALPTWKQQATREKEAELEFRGLQYVRALNLYQVRNGPNTAPPNLDALVEGKFLRKKYKDPITNDDFEPVLVGAPTVPGQQPQGQQPAGGPGRTGQPGQAPGVQPAAPGGSTFGGTIQGVRSKSTATSIKTYQGATRYSDWPFIRQAQAPQGPGGPVGPGGRQVGPGGVQGPGRGGPIGPGGVQGPGRGPVTAPPPGTGRGRGSH